jgi:hypothetical protein
MSPHQGEHVLPLWFGVIPAVLGVLIAMYLVVRISRDMWLRRQVNRDRPDPRKFSDYPELQAMTDRFYLTRYRLREAMDEDEAMSAKLRDERIHQIDALIERGIAHAEALRVATGSEEIVTERAAIDAIQAELEGLLEASST